MLVVLVVACLGKLLQFLCTLVGGKDHLLSSGRISNCTQARPGTARMIRPPIPALQESGQAVDNCILKVELFLSRAVRVMVLLAAGWSKIHHWSALCMDSSFHSASLGCLAGAAARSR